MRHAAAFNRDVQRWPGDRERPLTLAGQQRFRKTARGLASVAGRPEVVLASTLTRAWQTAQVLQDEAGWAAPIACAEMEPDASTADAINAIARHTGVPTLAVVGHEPNLGMLISALLAGADADFVSLKKGGAARLHLEPPVAAGSGTLRWLLTPRLLRGR